jgi:hypothetical protein
MRRLGVIDGVPQSYRDATRRIEIQIEIDSTLGTKPEELCVIGSPLKCIEIAAIEKLELFTAGWVDAFFEH